MSEMERLALLGMIQELPPELRERVKKDAEYLANWINEDQESRFIALALVGAGIKHGS